MNDVIEMLVNKGNTEEFDVFVCDHNMPTKQGMDFIKWLISEDVNVFYVLYSAGVNVHKNIIEECNSKGILFYDKTEQLSTLIEKLIMETANEPLSVPSTGRNTLSMEDLYSFIANDIIDDMEKVSGTDYQIRIGSKTYKPDDIIHELTNKTEFAFEYVKNYIEGLKFFNKK
jgi:DNA-binding NarL/FixJ family response regulator